MKLIIRTILFHMICIITFAFIYYNLYESFEEITKNKPKSFIDFVSLSVSIQSGIGLAYLAPISYYSKIAILIQELLLISTHVMTLYVFTL